jgi:hypothetical protein
MGLLDTTEEFVVKDKTTFLRNGYTVYVFLDESGNTHYVDTFPNGNVFIWKSAEPGDKIQVTNTFFNTNIYKAISKGLKNDRKNTT